MSSRESGISLVKKSYKTTIESLKDHPSIFFPFIIFAIFEFLALMLIYLAPRMPLKIIFGPPIRTFWGEIFLHYPANFLLIPKLTNLARMGLSILLGSVLTGMAVTLIYDIYTKKKVSLDTAFLTAVKKYLSLFTVVFLLTALFYFIEKFLTISLIKYFRAGHIKLLFLNKGLWLGPILICLNSLMAIIIQAAFIYAIPILMIEKEKTFKAIIRSFVLFKKLAVPTIILVGLPMLFYIPILVLSYNSAFLIDKIFPEFVILVSFLGILISSLVIDILVTVSTTNLYLINKGNQ